LRNLFKSFLIAAFMVLFAAAASASAWAAPIISSATINTSTQVITINGTNLVYGAKTSKVFFNGANPALSTSLQNVAGTKTTITAQLPDTVTAGTYVIRVRNGYGTSPAFDVTYGVGLVGPQGPAGAPGAAGEQGLQGPAGPQGPASDTVLLGKNSQLFTASGTFTVPDGVTQVVVEVCGAGGGGGYNDPGNTTGPFAGGGGGGGYLRALVTVTPGEPISVVVGAAGTTPDSSGDGTAGGDSSFGSIVAGGGQGGQSDVNGGSGGAGGTVNGGIFSFIGQGGEDGTSELGSPGHTGILTARTGLNGDGEGGHGGANLGTGGAGPGYVTVSW
jgi:hypothetical protein